MRSHLWRSIQLGLPESVHGCPELVKHALLVEVDGMSYNTSRRASKGSSMAVQRVVPFPLLAQ
jgi:hypothetical protein